MFAIPAPSPDSLELLLFLSPAVCGFPSPAQDYIEQTIDLNQICVEHPAPIFYVRASGHNMVGEGINDGDLLINSMLLSPKPACGSFDFDRTTLTSST
ncbi:UNVERIFIED_CONTAM: ImpA UV protection protein [Aeromonas salmonicida]